MTPWYANDELFKKLLSSGYGWQLLPYIFLRQNGFYVEMPALEVRDNLNDAKAFRDTIDILVEGHRIEIKSRSFRFTSPHDWPLSKNPLFVDTCSKWNAHEKQPLAYVFVSQVTGGMVCTDGRSNAEWSVVERFDSVRGIHESFYAVDREKLRTMDRLVLVLKSLRR